MTTQQVGKCSECSTEVEANARFCPNCGVSFTGEAPASKTSYAAIPYEYFIAKEGTHDKLTELINRAAAEGWEPVNVYAWNSGQLGAIHACLLRRAIPE